MGPNFLLRLKKEGYEISLNPQGDGRCFYHAAGFQLGLGTETVHNLIFDYLIRNQFDVCKLLISINIYGDFIYITIRTRCYDAVA